MTALLLARRLQLAEHPLPGGRRWRGGRPVAPARSWPPQLRATALASALLEACETVDAKLEPDVSYCTELRTATLESTEKLQAQLGSNRR